MTVLNCCFETSNINKVSHPCNSICDGSPETIKETINRDWSTDMSSNFRWSNRNDWTPCTWMIHRKNAWNYEAHLLCRQAHSFFGSVGAHIWFSAITVKLRYFFFLYKICSCHVWVGKLYLDRCLYRKDMIWSIHAVVGLCCHLHKHNCILCIIACVLWARRPYTGTKWRRWSNCIIITLLSAHKPEHTVCIIISTQTWLHEHAVRSRSNSIHPMQIN